MKVNLIEVPTPMFQSFTLFGKPNLELLKQEKKIRVSIHHIGKTRVSTSIQFGEFCNKVNFPVEGFKTFEKTEINGFSSEYVTSHYFIKSKKQGLKEFNEYVIKVIEHVVKKIFRLELDEITVEIETTKF